MELPGEWLDRGRVFLKDAARHLREGVYWLSCFDSHQAAEFYLKAFSIALTGIYPFSHDLVELLGFLEDAGVKVPKKLYVYADALTPHYTLSRYPGRKHLKYNKELAKRCLKYAKEIIKWVEKETSKKS